MRTILKRFRTKSREEAEEYVVRFRRHGWRLAWVECDGDQHFVCFRVKLRRVRLDLTIQPHLFN